MISFKPGQVVYLAHPGDVEKVSIVCAGHDRNLRHNIVDPYTVRGAGGDTWPVPSHMLHTDALAAAIQSSEVSA